LLLVGSPGHGYDKVQEAIDNSQFKSDIITTGWVSDEDLPTLMKGAEVFVFPSLAEGFGMPILEAMAAGVPVVTSESLREVGEDACVYVDPMRTDDIAWAVLKLQNADFRFQNIERGRERVKEFSWERCARETFPLLVGEG
jgi:glycosyltransferase involved in cell wall biosynthesis